MQLNDNPSVLIIAAEDSSTLYAKRILERWQELERNVAPFGVGSQAMEELGFERLGKSEEMAVMGFTEVLAHYSDIKDCFDRILAEVKKRKPKFALLLDYPGFNMRLAKKLKEQGVPVVYYISPQIWAWRQSRVHKIKKIVDKMLVLFPFEKDFYEKHGLDVTFVGHPLLDELDEKLFTDEYKSEKRGRYGITNSETLVGLMPGSRKSELAHHLETQLAVAKKILDRNKQVKIALLIAPGLDVDKLKAEFPEVDFPIIFIKDDPMAMVPMCDVVLCASGTATLIVGLLEVPLVIMYKMNTFSAWIAKMFVKSTPYFGMINLVLGKMVAPEFFQEKASVQNLYTEIDNLVYDSDSYQKMKSELKKARHNLGDKGVTNRVVETLEEYF